MQRAEATDQDGTLTDYSARSACQCGGGAWNETATIRELQSSRHHRRFAVEARTRDSGSGRAGVWSCGDGSRTSPVRSGTPVQQEMDGSDQRQRASGRDDEAARPNLIVPEPCMNDIRPRREPVEELGTEDDTPLDDLMRIQRQLTGGVDQREAPQDL